jgi:hypothetical protein
MTIKAIFMMLLKRGKPSLYGIMSIGIILMISAFGYAEDDSVVADRLVTFFHRAQQKANPPLGQLGKDFDLTILAGVQQATGHTDEANSLFAYIREFYPRSPWNTLRPGGTPVFRYVEEPEIHAEFSRLFRSWWTLSLTPDDPGITNTWLASSRFIRLLPLDAERIPPLPQLNAFLQQ